MDTQRSDRVSVATRRTKPTDQTPVGRRFLRPRARARLSLFLLFTMAPEKHRRTLFVFWHVLKHRISSDTRMPNLLFGVFESTKIPFFAPFCLLRPPLLSRNTAHDDESSDSGPLQSSGVWDESCGCSRKLAHGFRFEIQRISIVRQFAALMIVCYVEAEDAPKEKQTFHRRSSRSRG